MKPLEKSCTTCHFYDAANRECIPTPQTYAWSGNVVVEVLDMPCCGYGWQDKTKPQRHAETSEELLTRLVNQLLDNGDTWDDETPSLMM